MMILLALVAAAQAAPATPPAPATPAVPAVAAARYTLDTPIEQLVADPKAKAVIEADLPGLTTHAMYDMFKSMSLTQLQPLSQGRLTDAQLKKVATDLAVIK